MRLLTFVFLLFTLTSFARQNSFIAIDSIPQKGLLLDQGWKYKKGDNPEWANMHFNDADWSEIDPTQEIAQLPEIFDYDIKWLRIHITVNNQLQNLVGIAVNQAGASEIYLNGKLIHQFGNFDSDSKKVIAYDPLEIPILLPIDTIGNYTLAIRYRLQPNIKYTTIFGITKNQLFKATLVDLVPTLHLQRSFNAYYKGLDLFTIGAILMLFIFHLALFIYQRDNKTLLILAIYFLGASMIRVLKIIGQSEHLVENRFFTLNMANALISVVVVLLAIVVYRMARVRYDKYFYILIAYQVAYIFVSIFTYGKPYQTFMLLVGSLYGFFILLRLVVIGLNKGIKRFTVLGVFIGFNIIGLILITIAILSFNYGISPTGHNDLTIGFSPYWVDIIFMFASISVPIGLSLVIGIENRETNIELSNQLNLNEQLKDQAIKQELEKQLILENQNELLEIQVKERTAELHHSLETLKSTQDQLVQSEKLASLGELTAGIAHEIQNPLNFVNNFSEVTAELVEEVLEERKKDKTERDEALEDEILSDIKDNLAKIHHHGNRASSIVKGMLEHSRTSSGTKELTNINALADEYLRLAYHGLRAKDKTFNASFELELDSTIPSLYVFSQDLGRVILNLINNAFYAVTAKKASLSSTEVFKPTVRVSTKKLLDQSIELRISDNGQGIPDNIKNRIFEPFFTTKPAGKGTGLGLSLAYDIIKAHQGEIRVESKIGEGSTFVICLPQSAASI